MTKWREGPSVVVHVPKAASAQDAFAMVQEALGNNPNFRIETMSAYAAQRRLEAQHRANK